MDEHRLLARLARLGQRGTLAALRPLVETVHRDDDALLLEHRLKTGFSASVSDRALIIFEPILMSFAQHRHETPVEDLQRRFAIRAGHDSVDVVGRRGVVVVGQRGLRVERGAEVLGNPLW